MGEKRVKLELIIAAILRGDLPAANEIIATMDSLWGPYGGPPVEYLRLLHTAGLIKSNGIRGAMEAELLFKARVASSPDFLQGRFRGCITVRETRVPVVELRRVESTKLKHSRGPEGRFVSKVTELRYAVVKWVVVEGKDDLVAELLEKYI